MASVYDEYYDKALGLQNNFHDVVDNHSHPQIQSLQHEIHGLVDDFKSEKDPRAAENRIRIIEHQLLQAREQGEKLLSYQDADALQHQYQRLRENIHKLPNY